MMEQTLGLDERPFAVGLTFKVYIWIHEWTLRHVPADALYRR